MRLVPILMAVVLPALDVTATGTLASSVLLPGANPELPAGPLINERTDDRGGKQAEFRICNLEARVLVLSHRTQYSFNVNLPGGSSQGSAHCWALGTTLSHKLSEVAPTWCNATTGLLDDRVAFSWLSNDGVPGMESGSWTLQINHTVLRGGGAGNKSHQVGGDGEQEEVLVESTSHVIPASETDTHGNNTQFRFETYTGPANFSIPAFLSSAA